MIAGSSRPQNRLIRLPFNVPYYAQVASPELARAIFAEGLDAHLDPRCMDSGAETAEEYAQRWD